MKTTSSVPRIHLESYTVRIIALGLLALLLLIALAGCAPRSRSDAPRGAVGDYTLISVDGENVPCSLKHEGATMLVQSGMFNIFSNDTCRSAINFSIPPHKMMTREVTADYVRQGNELTMQWKGAGMTKGKLMGNEFIMTNEGMIFRYRK